MSYWLVDGDEEFNDIDSLCDFLFDPDSYDDDDAVEEYIDNEYSGVEICGVDFTASEIVRNLSDSLWDEMKSDWQNCQAENDRDYYYSTLENMEDGDREYIRFFTIERICDDEDDEEEEEPSEESREEFSSLFQTLM